MKQKFDPKIAREQLAIINELNNKEKTINIMEVCGTHTHAIGKNGIRGLMPDNIRLISGPGCPVCVTHEQEIEAMIRLAQAKNTVIATFGDVLRVPSSLGSLDQARSEGAQVKVVYSPLEAVEFAGQNPQLEVVFLGLGFETTAPLVGVSIMKARDKGLKNFSVYCLHKVVPPALEALLLDERVQINGFILPGHVSTVIGQKPYQFIADRFGKSGVISGFTPHDILDAIIMLLAQHKKGKAEIGVQYRRGMNPEGNPRARQVIEEVFTAGRGWWRGIGIIPDSGLAIGSEYKQFDAAAKFDIPLPDPAAAPTGTGCSCGEILIGLKQPSDCRLFGAACTPVNPVGPCMVSSEGTCAAYYRYRRYDQEVEQCR